MSRWTCHRKYQTGRRLPRPPGSPFYNSPSPHPSHAHDNSSPAIPSSSVVVVSGWGSGPCEACGGQGGGGGAGLQLLPGGSPCPFFLLRGRPAAPQRPSAAAPVLPAAFNPQHCHFSNLIIAPPQKSIHLTTTPCPPPHPLSPKSAFHPAIPSSPSHVIVIPPPSPPPTSPSTKPAFTPHQPTGLPPPIPPPLHPHQLNGLPPPIPLPLQSPSPPPINSTVFQSLSTPHSTQNAFHPHQSLFHPQSTQPAFHSTHPPHQLNRPSTPSNPPLHPHQLNRPSINPPLHPPSTSTPINSTGLPTINPPLHPHQSPSPPPPSTQPAFHPQQFVHNEFPTCHEPTSGRVNYWPSVNGQRPSLSAVSRRSAPPSEHPSHNGREATHAAPCARTPSPARRDERRESWAPLPRVGVLPSARNGLASRRPTRGGRGRAFPQNSYSEWADYRFYGLRSAMAYMFVFDLTSYDSFTHIKALRDQIYFPTAMSTKNRDANREQKIADLYQVLNMSFDVTLAADDVIRLARALRYESRDMREVGVVVVGNKRDLLDSSDAPGQGEMREVAVVRKQWKASYVEVSAKCNWHVVAAFRELLLAVPTWFY
ncbi:hypothetical protein C7M84_003075 [Penaeus vannamei]|uniref:Uncharacterized protein n=1 Tax=Penaeus vannamei TaxID=6689 RepID=A0A3R7QGK3_PENVA|nr:hypothetical protein C7M84_003075 [Penaeus vannamei]